MTTKPNAYARPPEVPLIDDAELSGVKVDIIWAQMRAARLDSLRDRMSDWAASLKEPTDGGRRFAVQQIADAATEYLHLDAAPERSA